MAAERFKMLFVCHANLCRSPMAERLARRSLTDRVDPTEKAFDVVSAGTHAWSNRPMHPLAAKVMLEYGADNADFRSRRLTAGMVTRADLILTATRQQRAACVVFDPIAVRRTFTILQFGRYATALSPVGLAGLSTPRERLLAMIDQLSVIRGELPVPPAEDDELPDPVKLPVEGFRRCAGEVQAMIDVMIDLIVPTPPTS